MKILRKKLSIIWSIISNKYEHFAIINIERKELINLFKGDDFEVQIQYIGLKGYTFFSMIKNIANSKSDIDMALDKAQFEAEAIINSKKYKN